MRIQFAPDQPDENRFSHVVQENNSMNESPGTRMKRDGTADLLKGFAVLFMIQVHIMEQFVSPDTSGSMIGKISMFLGGPPCAPVFLAVMGYFLASSQKSPVYFLKRGGLLLLGGILLNTARSANLLWKIILGEVDLDPLFFILGADILTLAGLSLVLTGLLRLIYGKSKWLYFLTALVFAGISPLLDEVGFPAFLPGYLAAFIYGTAGWSYFPLFPWFAYVLTGYSFSLLMMQNKAAAGFDIQNKFIYFIPLWIGVIITIPYAASVAYNLVGTGGYYHHGIQFFGWVILFMISYLILVKLVEISYGQHVTLRIVKWMGKNVTVLYVIQWLIIGNLAPFLFRSQGLFQFVAWFVAITIATMLTGLLVGKIGRRQKLSYNASSQTGNQ